MDLQYCHFSALNGPYMWQCAMFSSLLLGHWKHKVCLILRHNMKAAQHTLRLVFRILHVRPTFSRLRVEGLSQAAREICQEGWFL